MRAQDAFSNLLPKIAAKYPGSYAGGVFAPKPGEASVIRFKGLIPPGAADDIAVPGLRIDARGGAEYTQKEIRDRSIAIAEHLSAVGYRDIVTAVMPQGFVEVTVGSTSGPAPVLPPGLREDARVTTIAGPRAARSMHVAAPGCRTTTPTSARAASP